VSATARRSRSKVLLAVLTAIAVIALILLGAVLTGCDPSSVAPDGGPGPGGY
jgi:hypothetical protein